MSKWKIPRNIAAGDWHLTPFPEGCVRSAMFIAIVPGGSQAPLGAACDYDGNRAQGNAAPNGACERRVFMRAVDRQSLSGRFTSRLLANPRLVDSVLLQLGVDRLGETRFLETDYLGSFDAEE